jgi:hypothetical protein
MSFEKKIISKILVIRNEVGYFFNLFLDRELWTIFLNATEQMLHRSSAQGGSKKSKTNKP